MVRWWMGLWPFVFLGLAGAIFGYNLPLPTRVWLALTASVLGAVTIVTSYWTMGDIPIYTNARRVGWLNFTYTVIAIILQGILFLSLNDEVFKAIMIGVVAGESFLGFLMLGPLNTSASIEED